MNNLHHFRNLFISAGRHIGREFAKQAPEFFLQEAYSRSAKHALDEVDRVLAEKKTGDVFSNTPKASDARAAIPLHQRHVTKWLGEPPIKRNFLIHIHPKMIGN